MAVSEGEGRCAMWRGETVIQRSSPGYPVVLLGVLALGLSAGCSEYKSVAPPAATESGDSGARPAATSSEPASPAPAGGEVVQP